MIYGKNISWKYQNKNGSCRVLNDVSFEIRKGRITTFMGQSGAGKTTLLKCIANLNADYDGVIICNDSDLSTFGPVQRATTVGFVLQQFHLYPHLSVLKNCTFALVNTMKMDESQADTIAFATLTP